MDDAPRSPEAAGEAAATFALPAQEEDVETLRRSVVAKLTYAVGKDPIAANDRDWFVHCQLRKASDGHMESFTRPVAPYVVEPDANERTAYDRLRIREEPVAPAAV